MGRRGSRRDPWSEGERKGRGGGEGREGRKEDADGREGDEEVRRRSSRWRVDIGRLWMVEKEWANERKPSKLLAVSSVVAV